MQFSTPVRNALLDSIESTIGASPILKVFAGTIPTNCAASDGANAVLATIALPSDWMNAASGGVKTLSGTWEDIAADANGTASYFRIFDNAGTTCHNQGTITAPGGGGDMTFDNVVFAVGQDIKVNTFTLTAPNA